MFSCFVTGAVNFTEGFSLDVRKGVQEKMLYFFFPLGSGKDSMIT
jgi:hypothetical protein